MAKNHLPLLYYETMKTMKLASSTGYAVLVPLGAALFMARGRHPAAGPALILRAVVLGKHRICGKRTGRPFECLIFWVNYRLTGDGGWSSLF